MVKIVILLRKASDGQASPFRIFAGGLLAATKMVGEFAESQILAYIYNTARTIF